MLLHDVAPLYRIIQTFAPGRGRGNRQPALSQGFCGHTHAFILLVSAPANRPCVTWKRRSRPSKQSRGEVLGSSYSLIGKSGHRFSIATNEKCVCAEIMRKQQAKTRFRFDLTQSRFSALLRLTGCIS